MSGYVISPAGTVYRADKLSLGTVAEFRPVVVIDPEDRDQLKELTDRFMHLLRTGKPDRPAMYEALRSLIAPPKPEEPTGLGAVVEDAEGVRWVRVPPTRALQPRERTDWCDESGEFVHYDALNAVRVLSAGWSE